MGQNGGRPILLRLVLKASKATGLRTFFGHFLAVKILWKIEVWLEFAQISGLNHWLGHKGGDLFLRPRCTASGGMPCAPAWCWRR